MKLPAKVFNLLLAFFVLASTASAQMQSDDLSKILATPNVRRALDFVKEYEPKTIEEQIRTCEIPAPPFKEQVRAEYYKKRCSEQQRHGDDLIGEHEFNFEHRL